MNLHTPEIGWVWLGLGLGAVVCLLLAWKLRRPTGIPVAHLERLAALPRYAQLLRHHRIRVAVSAVALVAALGACVYLSARPFDHRTETTPERQRDIMLCLDVSDSMSHSSAEAMVTFQSLASQLRGDRVGLTIFNGTAQTVVPLTDDTPYLLAQLREGARALRAYDFGYTAGTLGGSGASSLVPDGLTSCIARFDRTDEDRVRSIVLATDNDVAGRPLFTMPEAVALARERGIRVHVIEVDYERDGTLASQAASTGGSYHYSLSSDAVDGMVRRIATEEASRAQGPPRRVEADSPGPATLVLLPIALIALASLRGVRP